MPKKILFAALLCLPVLARAGSGAHFYSGEKVFVLLKNSSTVLFDGYVSGRVIGVDGQMVRITVNTVHANHTDAPILKRLGNQADTHFVAASKLVPYAAGIKRYRSAEAAANDVLHAARVFLRSHYKQSKSLAQSAQNEVSVYPGASEVKVGARIVENMADVMLHHRDHHLAKLKAATQANEKTLEMLRRNHLYSSSDILPTTNVAMFAATRVSQTAGNNIPVEGLLSLSDPGRLKTVFNAYFAYSLSSDAIDYNLRKNSSRWKQNAKSERSMDAMNLARVLAPQAEEQAGLNSADTLEKLDTAQDRIQALIKPAEAILGPQAFEQMYRQIERKRRQLNQDKNDALRSEQMAYERLSRPFFKREAGIISEKRTPKTRIKGIQKYLKEYPHGHFVKQAHALIANIRQHQADQVKSADRQVDQFASTLLARLERQMHGCHPKGIDYGGTCKLHVTHVSPQGHFMGYVTYSIYNGDMIKNAIKGRVIKHYKDSYITLWFKEYRQLRNTGIPHNEPLGQTWIVHARVSPNAISMLTGETTVIHKGQKPHEGAYAIVFLNKPMVAKR